MLPVLSSRQPVTTAVHCYWKLGLLLGLLWLTTTALAADFRVMDASTHLDKGVYFLDAKLKLRFPDGPLEALQNGVPLIVELDIQVFRQREWLWDEIAAQLQQRFRLEYHALSRQYVISNLNSGELKSFSDLKLAVAYLSLIERFPLLDASLLPQGSNYMVRMRAILDIESLPVPLQLVAYLSPEWRISSEWYTWPL
ncbi:MAG: DUF4390 domain-containing protein [Candidatus Competibacteraceae bacterium]